MRCKFSIVLIILSLFFFSCKGSVSQDYSGSVTVDSQQVAQYVTQRSARVANMMHPDYSFEGFSGGVEDFDVKLELIVKLTTQGDYSTTAQTIYSQTVPFSSYDSDSDPSEDLFFNNVGKTVTISGIPVGSNISVNAEVSFRMSVDLEALIQIMLEENPDIPEEYLRAELAEMGIANEEYLIAVGKSNNITVQSGSNPVTIRMTVLDEETDGEGHSGGQGGNGGGQGGGQTEIDPDSNIDFMVYTYTKNSGIKYFIEDKTGLDSIDDSNPDFETSLETVAYCFDNEGTFYALSKDAQNRQIIMSEKYGNTVIDDIPDSDTLDGITIDQATNAIYIWAGNQGTFTLYKLSDFVSSEDDTAETISNITFSGDFGINYHDNDAICVNNGILYGFGCNGSREIGNNMLYKVDLSDTTPAAQALTFNYSSSGIPNSAKVTDMIYQNGALYILVKDISDQVNIFYEYSQAYNQDNPINSRGAVIKYTISGATTEALGWTSSAIPTTGKYVYGYDQESRTNRLMTTPSTNGNVAGSRYKEDISVVGNKFPPLYVPATETAGFYGPRKIVAIKPKRLYIADDGMAFYSDSNDAFNCYNVNRIVAIDLDDFSISTSIDTVVKFDGEETGLSVGGSGFYHEYSTFPTVYKENEADAFVPSNGRMSYGFPNTGKL